MAYKSLNFKNVVMRENGTSKRIREEKLLEGHRYEFHRGMNGQVYQITDHERKVFFRQDHYIREQFDLFDEKLPRWCDYCQSQCDVITLVEYKAIYEMIVRPKIRPELKRDEIFIHYAACSNCSSKEKVIPEILLQGYLVELYENGKRVWKK